MKLKLALHKKIPSLLLLSLSFGCDQAKNINLPSVSAVLTASQKQGHVGERLVVDASQSSYESIEWSVNGAVLIRCQQLAQCSIDLEKLGSIEVGILVSAGKGDLIARDDDALKLQVVEPSKPTSAPSSENSVLKSPVVPSEKPMNLLLLIL